MSDLEEARASQTDRQTSLPGSKTDFGMLGFSPAKKQTNKKTSGSR